VRFIQIGVGGFGRSWLRHMAQDATASLAAVVDTDEEALAAARAATGLTRDRCFTDYRVALERARADALLCVTPPALHHEVAVAALECGLNVLMEKPLADTMERAQEMVATADRLGRVLMVSQNYRFRSWVRTMRYLIDSGQFGVLDNVTVRFARAPRFEGSFRLRMEHPLVRDMSIHHFDLMRAVTGREPVSVFARTWRPAWSWYEHDPCAVAVFEFSDGIGVFYAGSWVARGQQTTWDGRWSAECAEAIIELRGSAVHIVMAERPGQDTEVALHAMPCEDQAYALLEFQRAVGEGREPEASGRDNLRSLAMVFAVTESARRGRPVEVDHVLADDRV
jgi:predicted dehydrogenase